MSPRWLVRLPALVALVTFIVVARPLFAVTIDEVMDQVESPWLSSETRGDAKNETGGEEKAELETDRDSFTFATTTVATGRVLVESAYSFIDNRNTPADHSFPELITRIGLTKRLELRLGWNYEVGGGGDVSSGDAGGDLVDPGSKKETQIMYGFKYALTDQDAWLPASACIVQGSTPTSGPENNSRIILGYVFGWKIFNNWKLDSAIRYETMKEESDYFSQWAPSVVLKIPVADRWNVHGEYFGIFTDGRANNTNAQYFSPGISYLLTPACEVGVRVGWGLNQDAASFFSNVGFGLMF